MYINGNCYGTFMGYRYHEYGISINFIPARLTFIQLTRKYCCSNFHLISSSSTLIFCLKLNGEERYQSTRLFCLSYHLVGLIRLIVIHNCYNYVVYSYTYFDREIIEVIVLCFFFGEVFYVNMLLIPLASGYVIQSTVQPEINLGPMNTLLTVGLHTIERYSY